MGRSFKLLTTKDGYELQCQISLKVASSQIGLIFFQKIIKNATLMMKSQDMTHFNLFPILFQSLTSYFSSMNTIGGNSKQEKIILFRFLTSEELNYDCLLELHVGRNHTPWNNLLDRWEGVPSLRVSTKSSGGGTAQM